MSSMSTPSLRGHAALRCGRCSVVGQIFLVTTTTRFRRPLFAQWELGCAAARAMGRPALIAPDRLLCWVLMPDHWHGLLQLGSAGGLVRAMRKLKSASALAVNRNRGGSGAVWAPAYHDRALRHDDDVLAAARYVIANPTRAGLVRSVGQYPFWDAVWL